MGASSFAQFTLLGKLTVVPELEVVNSMKYSFIIVLSDADAKVIVNVVEVFVYDGQYYGVGNTYCR